MGSIVELPDVKGQDSIYVGVDRSPKKVHRILYPKQMTLVEDAIGQGDVHVLDWEIIERQQHSRRAFLVNWSGNHQPQWLMEEQVWDSLPEGESAAF
ncbi:hypothetical protein cyc_02080 [Cyclospora cayetanensis]|uniref:Chromo domain-containing protein n=1 Tax=Cyclospora cayetanensis TaxID=88456 RepID=A0A1D3D056_9EIME|nr:hypothetical protein cyc_02080 [Cyclospora cayetanensis]